MAEKYISQFSEKIEGRITKKLCQEFSRTESRILGGLSKLDEFLLNTQVRTCSVAVPGTSRKSNSGNRELNGDRSPNDPGTEAMASSHHSGNLNNSEVEENPHMVMGGQEEIRNGPHMLKRLQEEIPYCFSVTWSGKQKKARSTNQSQLRSENTPGTIEADQILLAFQQLASNSISANFPTT